jgi:hypothetical protein
MADTRTAASRYPSRQGGWVTASQFLAEMMCERQARAMKRTLPLQFWKVKPWGDVYRQQVVAANRLLRLLDPDKTGTGPAAVLQFLKSERGKKVYSLAPAWVIPLVEAAHRAVLAELAREAARPAPEPPPAPTPPLATGPMPAFVRKESVLSKLEGL